MIIKVRRSQTGVDEWHMIELQGELINKSGGTLDGKVIGDLHFTKQNEPFFIVGHHMLQGKTVTLSNPFAVLKRLRSEDGTELSIIALIKTKIVFRTRPKPIIWMEPK